jgi:hypothetical protein
MLGNYIMDSYDQRRREEYIRSLIQFFEKIQAKQSQ